MQTLTAIPLRTWLSLFVLAAAVTVAGCSSGSLTPTESVVEPPPPSPTAVAATAPDTAIPDTPTPLPTATPTPPPTVAPIEPVTIVRASPIGPGPTTPQAYAGTVLTFAVAGLDPLESAAVFYVDPRGRVAGSLSVRADAGGEATWRRESLGDSPGDWSVQLRGENGTRLTVAYRLTELELPLEDVVSEGTSFSLYRTPEGRIFFDPAVPAAMAVLIAQDFSDGLSQVQLDLDYQLDGGLDFYLLPDNASLVREAEAGGAEEIAGFEAGLSLYAFPRSGIYLDVSGSPLLGMPHVVAHEVVHQIAARIEANRNAPLWFIEGVADFEGFKAGLARFPEQERQWRRQARNIVRDAVVAGDWIDLTTLGGYEVWQRGGQLERLNLMYSQAFVTVDYVARTYGDHTLRPLLEGLADSPTELDAVFQRLFAMSFAEFQQRVRSSVVELDTYEREIAALIDYARRLFAEEQVTRDIGRRWNGYLTRRLVLPRDERVEAMRRFSEEYRAMDARVQAITPPEKAVDVHDVLRSASAAFVRAANAFVVFEASGDGAAREAGNEALLEANFRFSAAQDLIVQLLEQSGVARGEVFGAFGSP